MTVNTGRVETVPNLGVGLVRRRVGNVSNGSVGTVLTGRGLTVHNGGLETVPIVCLPLCDRTQGGLHSLKSAERPRHSGGLV